MLDQPSLFIEQSGSKGLSIGETSELLNVSVATVRNWLKAGYLEYDSCKKISLNSISYVRNNILGTRKLISRANKSLKSTHDHTDLERQVMTMLESEEVSGCYISNFYEKSLSESHKNQEGIFYTPEDLVTEFFKKIPKNRENLIFCDPCCGTGNFLVAALQNGFKAENIYGYDTDSNAVLIARKRLREMGSLYDMQIEVSNGLVEMERKQGYFDIIFSNPPWGKKMPKKEKEYWGKLLKTEKNQDSSALFFLVSLYALKQKGFLGFLLPESFFNIAIFEPVRKVILNNKIIYLSDFGKVFSGLVTKAQGIILQNILESEGTIQCSDCNGNIEIIEKSVFKSNPKSILNFHCSAQDLQVINYLMSKSYVTLRDSANWGVGIVTGNNKEFCREKPFPNSLPVYRGVDIQKGVFKPPSCFISNNLSKYQQVAPLHLFLAKEKIVYRFIANYLSVACDTEQRFCLNSANFFILHSDFPINHIQLAELLNSRLMTWLFQKIFNTHKVLRKDLESLPIFTDFFVTKQKFLETDFLDFLGLIEDKSNGTYRIKTENL